MARLRKPLQGITNIIRFNWHFYLFAGALVLSSYLVGIFTNGIYYLLTQIFSALIIVPVIISLVVSWYVYDFSSLYQFKWIDELQIPCHGKIVNVHAGFDETSTLLQRKFPDAELLVYDFYDPAKHTEVSIKRARKAYPSYIGTQRLNTLAIPLKPAYADCIFIIFAAHEIRDLKEQTVFFKELRTILKHNWKNSNNRASA